MNIASGDVAVHTFAFVVADLSDADYRTEFMMMIALETTFLKEFKLATALYTLKNLVQAQYITTNISLLLLKKSLDFFFLFATVGCFTFSLILALFISAIQLFRAEIRSPKNEVSRCFCLTFIGFSASYALKMVSHH